MGSRTRATFSLGPYGAFVVGGALLAACRLGGPADELTINSAVGPSPDSGTTAGSTTGGDTDGTTAGATTGASSVGGTTGGATTGGGGVDAGVDATLDSGGGTPDTGIDPGTCTPPGAAPAVCDPVCNTGCGTLSRCDIADTPNTGRCIGIWISKEGEFCLKTASTNPCAPQLACDNSACIHMCYNDSDCASAVGKCCNKALVDTGSVSPAIKGCGACN